VKLVIGQYFTKRRKFEMARLPMTPMDAGPPGMTPMDAGPPGMPPMDAGPPGMASPPMNGSASMAESIGPEGMQAMLAPDEGVQMILLARMEALSPPELEALDAAITPETASILMKLLPELGELIGAYGGQTGGQRGVGALANV
jgi:hypothetical protein